MLRSARDVAEDVALASAQQAVRNVTADRLALVERLRTLALDNPLQLHPLLDLIESEIRAAAEGEE